jgi:hypothetical protein
MKSPAAVADMLFNCRQDRSGSFPAPPKGSFPLCEEQYEPPMTQMLVPHLPSCSHQDQHHEHPMIRRPLSTIAETMTTTTTTEATAAVSPVPKKSAQYQHLGTKKQQQQQQPQRVMRFLCRSRDRQQQQRQQQQQYDNSNMTLSDEDDMLPLLDADVASWTLDDDDDDGSDNNDVEQ